MSLVEPVVSILIVSADSGAGVRECVARALASSVPVEVILIDNASRDGVPQAIAHGHANDPRVRVLFNETNLGFGPAINLGERHANADALLILNPDCMLETDTIERMLAIARENPEAGVIGAVVCDENGTPDPASRRRDPLLRRALNQLTGRAKREAHGETLSTKFEGINMPGPMPTDVEKVEAVSGALMLMPRAVFEQLHGFDEKYFLHCEDLDICRRARDAGYDVLLAGNVRVLHGKGGSSAHRPVFVSRHKHRGMWRWFCKFDPAARNPFARALVWCGIWTHFALTAPMLSLSRLRERVARSAG